MLVCNASCAMQSITPELEEGSSETVRLQDNICAERDGEHLIDAVQSLDVFLAGDDVDKKKPDPTIYRIAAERLGVNPQDCLVVEDSTIGLKVIFQLQD